MSPDQLAGTEHLDARSDVYSLGATLYEMLTPERPFVASASPAGWPQAAIRREALPVGHWLVGETESLLGDCLAKRRK